MSTETNIRNYARATSENRVTRVPPSEKLLETSISCIEQKVTAELQGAVKSFEEKAQHLAKAVAPIHRLIEQDQQAVASLDVLHKLATEDQQRWVEADKRFIDPELAKTFTFTANLGFNVIAPPYDVEWTTPESPELGVSNASKRLGELSCQLIDGGRFFRAAAVGVFLSSPVRSLVRCAPFASLSWSWQMWSLFQTIPSTKGAVGVMAYFNADPQPFLDKQALLWNETRVLPSLGESDAGHFIGLVPPRSGSVTFPGDALILMEPGNTYLVWVWCWVMRHLSATNPTTLKGNVHANIRCSVPFIVIDSGPPPPPIG